MTVTLVSATGNPATKSTGAVVAAMLAPVGAAVQIAAYLPTGAKPPVHSR